MEQAARPNPAHDTAQQAVQRSEDTPRTASQGGYTPRPNYYGGNPAPQQTQPQPNRGNVNVEEDDLDIPPFLKRRR